MQQGRKLYVLEITIYFFFNNIFAFGVNVTFSIISIYTYS